MALNAVQMALQISAYCQGSSSTYYGSVPEWSYLVDTGIVAFRQPFPLPAEFGAARIMVDSLTLRWKPDATADSLTLTFVKQ
jgi:hypothetical protein